MITITARQETDVCVCVCGWLEDSADVILALKTYQNMPSLVQTFEKSESEQERITRPYDSMVKDPLSHFLAPYLTHHTETQTETPN